MEVYHTILDQECTPVPTVSAMVDQTTQSLSLDMVQITLKLRTPIPIPGVPMDTERFPPPTINPVVSAAGLNWPYSASPFDLIKYLNTQFQKPDNQY